MKIFKVIALILAMLVAFSGCSLNFFSVESLLKPPAQSGANGKIQDAFNELMKERVVQLKAPVSGEYQTSFILYDVNADGVDEALVFYSDSATEGSVRLALMENINRNWEITVDIKGSGNGIYDVNFIDINNDDVVEIFISWTLLDSQTTRIVSIFELSEDGQGKSILRSVGNEYGIAKCFGDFNSDGKTDLSLVYLDDTDNTRKSYVRFFTIDDTGAFFKYAEVSIDSTLLSVSSMHSDVVYDDGSRFARIFIDCLKNEKMKYTEMIYWDNELSLPVRAYSNPAFTTARNSLISSQDIDNDGLIEVPVLATLFGFDSSLAVTKEDVVYVFTMIEWLNVKGDSSEESVKTLLNPIDNYLFVFPWEDKVTVTYNARSNELSFFLWSEEEKVIGDELFSIKYVAESPESDSLRAVGIKFYESSYGDYFYDITPEGADYGITDDLISESFVLID